LEPSGEGINLSVVASKKKTTLLFYPSWNEELMAGNY